MTTEQEAVLRRRLAELEAENLALRTERRDASTAEDKRATKLMADVQHRVRNMLATIRAIISRTAAGSSEVQEFAAHLTGRVDTLVRLQAALSRTGEAGLDLEELVREEFVAQAGFAAEEPVIEGPAVTLPWRYAEILGLAVHELATNSVKFGALSVDTGRVTVLWHLNERPDGSILTLSWAESGASLPPDTDPDRRGFGRELLEAGLPYQMDAKTKLEFRTEGLLCTIEVPLRGNRPSGAPAPTDTDLQ